jgi:hypothetical protein
MIARLKIRANGLVREVRMKKRCGRFSGDKGWNDRSLSNVENGGRAGSELLRHCDIRLQPFILET